MLIALTHVVPEAISRCELTYLERQPIYYHLAVEQHAEYCRALARNGASILELNENADYPDSCFVEDTAIVTDKLAVITRMGAESRRGEVNAIERFFSTRREVIRISEPGTLEGGDVIVAGNRVFVGLSQRTNQEGIRQLGAILGSQGYTVSQVMMRDCLHLKSACTFIGEETFLTNPEWLDLRPFEKARILSVAQGEPWAANALRVGETVLMGSTFVRTIDKLERSGFRVEGVPISEFLKAEAGLTCSSILFDGDLS